MTTSQSSGQGLSHQDHQDTAKQTTGRHTKVSTSSKKSPTAFRTISEVAETLDVQQHVLRFWETKFSQVKPLKRGGGRRYYRPEDVALLQTIHHLLYTEGYTIKGVQKLLKGQGKQQIISGELSPAANESNAVQQTNTPVAAQPEAQNTQSASEPEAPKEGLSEKQRSILQAMLGDLRDIRDLIKK